MAQEKQSFLVYTTQELMAFTDEQLDSVSQDYTNTRKKVIQAHSDLTKERNSRHAVQQAQLVLEGMSDADRARFVQVLSGVGSIVPPTKVNGYEPTKPERSEITRTNDDTE